jgi:transposase
MYRDPLLWKKIQHRILVDGISIKQVTKATGISRPTIRKMLANPFPKLYSARSCSTSELTARKPTCVPRVSNKDDAKDSAFEWMRAVLQGEIDLTMPRNDVGHLCDIKELMRRLYDGRLSERNRTMAVLAKHHGIPSHLICRFLGIDRKTVRRYCALFRQAGASALFATQTRSNRKFDNDLIKSAVFKLLHEPPSNHGINRTSWTMPLLSRVLRETGHPVSPGVIRKITKTAGYRWRKARIVLTSNDPEFSEKLNRVRTILSKLRPHEAFFSIDEFGPFAVKAKPGLTLEAPGEPRVVSQWQKSRGCLIVTAALELSGNQVHHFFSTEKNTLEMIRMMNLLIDLYRDRRKIYLSWDAASWHVSKELYKRIEKHNSSAKKPIVETVALPSGAQFLNVIESVFSGMARAIIHNSDYASLDAAKVAIDQYFLERNLHFKQNPRKAGNLIWGKEREPATFSVSNNCKDPRYR